MRPAGPSDHRSCAETYCGHDAEDKKVEKTWVREEVQKSWRPIALDALRGFFDRFGWDPGEGRLRQ